MSFRGVASRRFGTFAASLALAIGLMGASAPAEARHRHSHVRSLRAHFHVRHYVHIRRHSGRAHHFVAAARTAGGPPAAEIVVDANSGRTLYGYNENELRHPASLTKVMTLYLLFEQLDRGRLNMASELPISAHAAAQAPSKLGLRPGSTIDVDDAIKAIVTKSANDIAVTVAEAVGGDEDTFAEMMTRKAHALGMSRTHYANASGLPNSEQITTAHDLAILGRAIQDRFPRYYRYFSTRSFTFAGRVNRNHNHLLGKVEGMDGIKTGYTAASGFNLLTSVRRDGHHVVAVVLGGRSAAARDRRMANLIEEHIDTGAGARTVAAVSESSDDDAPAREPSRPAIAEAPRMEPPARIEPAVARTEPAQTTQARAEAPALRLAIPQTPLEAERARTAGEKPRPAFVSGAARIAQADSAPEKTTLRLSRAPIVTDGSTSRRGDAVASATPSALRWVKGPQPARSRIEAMKSGHTAIAKAEPAKASAAEPRPVAHSGWMIQIGATDDAGKANELLSRAKGRSRTVASAQAFTEKVQKGKETLYRARFAGLQENAAESACRELKRSGFSCFAMKN